ncbi:MAG TPA: CBS domain-containing protein [Candidatus Limnocylindrales bacterium]|nr:CBS domain-containing protein [Candidatus Limnocylindrales bacterium]
MTVRDVMTRDVVTVRPETPLKQVARLLVERGISGVPVVSPDGRVLGVVSEADFLVKERGVEKPRHRALASLFGDSAETLARLEKVAAATAGDAMTAPAITIEADRTIRDAADLMTSHAVNRLPVTDRRGLLGIVTRADLVRAYLRPDEDLERAIRDEVLRATLWLDPRNFTVAVTQGVARISGRVERRSTAAAIERMAALVPGVIGVAAEIEWEVDDRDIEAPERDYFSPFTAPGP